LPIPTPRPTPAPTAISSAIHPEPDPSSRERSAPLVIRATPTKPGGNAAANDSCTCRIEGTVEVDSDKPLSAELPVAVSLVWYPAVADTVRLFMGSPRAFHLPPSPCGPQRLKVTTFSRDRYDVVTREAVSGFRCEGVGTYQVRIVLRPAILRR